MIEFFAEIGSNYITKDGPDFNRALRLIDAAAEIGCAGVKFQYFKADNLWHPSMVKEWNAAEAYELPFKWIPKLSEYAKRKGLLFGLSVFDEPSIYEVERYVDYYKIASFEIGLFELIKKCYLTGKRLMLSMGQCGKEEIQETIKRLPDLDNQIDILHCVSEYPASPSKCNLSIIKENPWINGWSDHTVNAGVMGTAIACGAKIIEFHLDLNDCNGVETKHSWAPCLAMPLIKNVPIIEEALGVPSWNIIKANQDLQYKADSKTGLRGKG